MIPTQDSADTKAIIEAARDLVVGPYRQQSFEKLSKLIISADNSRIKEEIGQLASYVPPYDWQLVDELREATCSRLLSMWTYPFGTRKLRDHLNYFAPALKRMSIKGARVLDFGAGILAPHLLTTFFYLNGASYCVSAEPRPIEDTVFAARSLRDILLQTAGEASQWVLPGVTPRQYLSRFAEVDWEALARNDYDSALAGLPVEHRIGFIESFPDICDLDLIHSIAVFEHIMELDHMFAELRDRLKPGGLMCHVVDFSDHAHDPLLGQHRWDYLINPNSEGGNINQIRTAEMVRVMERNGLEVLDVVRYKTEIPHDLMNNIRPKFAALSREEIETYCAVLVAKRR